jgi:hypothetical protein
MTPFTWPNAFFTVTGQTAQCMPGTDRDTLLGAAKAFEPSPSSKRQIGSNRFIVNS